MNISGIHPYQGFYSYNSIKLNELRGQQIMAAQQNVAAANETVQPEEPVNDYIDRRPIEQNFGSYDYAQTYNPDEQYDMIGSESDINSLDKQKIMSDLDKDQVLQQYQFFVGNDPMNAISGGADHASAVQRSGENFSL